MSKLESRGLSTFQQHESMIDIKRSAMGNLPERIRLLMDYASRTVNTLEPYTVLNSQLESLLNVVTKCYDDRSNERSEFAQVSSSIIETCDKIKNECKKYAEAKQRS